jgi:hypothetical protein
MDEHGLAPPCTASHRARARHLTKFDQSSWRVRAFRAFIKLAFPMFGPSQRLQSATMFKESAQTVFTSSHTHSQDAKSNHHSWGHEQSREQSRQALQAVTSCG